MVERKKIKELLNESACEHNNSSKKTPCNKPKPGATSGGCAFEGAQISLFPYADAIHLVHGPMTCLGSSWETRATKTSYKHDYTQLGFTTDMNLNDVIFGCENKLSDSIDYIMQNYSPEAIFIYSTCVSALIGDDIDVVCKSAQAKYDIPVVPVHSPGFVGSKNLGSRLGAEAVLDYLIGTKEPKKTTKYDINLIGEYNVTGDMWQYSHLLKELGINILSTLSGDGRIEDIRGAHRAKLNVIVCAKSLITICRKMKEKYNIPFVSVSFYGKSDTREAILTIVKHFVESDPDGSKDLSLKAQKLIEQEESKLEEKLEPYKEFLKGKRAILNTGGNKSWSFVSAMQDLGMEVVATSVRKATLEDKEKAREYLGSEGILMENPGGEQAKIIDEKNVDILLAGGRSLYTAIKKRIAFIDVNQEKTISYGGYDGLVNFAKDLYFAIKNPVFKNVAKESPWAK